MNFNEDMIHRSNLPEDVFGILHDLAWSDIDRGSNWKWENMIQRAQDALKLDDRFQKAKPRTPVRKVSAKKRAADKGYPDLRHKVAARALYTCQRCEKWAPLVGHPLEIGHLHHKTYRSHGGKHTMANSCWLCSSCHDTEHNGEKPCPSKVQA